MKHAALRQSLRDVFIACSCFLMVAALSPAQAPDKLVVKVDWNHTLLALKTVPTLQVVANPMLRRGSPVHDGAFKALRSLGADFVRYPPWWPYPKLSVAELDAPTAGKTFWDFGSIDPMVEDFFAATDGHPVILNFSTIPAWMFKTEWPVAYPGNPDEVDWGYLQGQELRDPTLEELSGYYSRIAGWYCKGGFADEIGQWHQSDHHYKIRYWEVFNEMEHHPTPPEYAARYDAVVEAIRQVSPDTKFIGLALAGSNGPERIEYFLDHTHHKPGIPIDYISYHFYAQGVSGETVDHWQYTFFEQADALFVAMEYIDAIRKRLSPQTKTILDEVGTMLPTDNTPEGDKDVIPEVYWNLSAAVYAYVFMGAAQRGIDILGESQLVGFPSQYPSVSMVDWKHGNPNARFRVLQLLHDGLHMGDILVDTDIEDPSVAAQAFQTPTGRKLLLINKRSRQIAITLPQGFTAVGAITVDVSTGANLPLKTLVSGEEMILQPFAVSIVSNEK